MSPDTLSGYVEATAAKFGIPGVAVGVWAGGREDYACHGVTSIENPLPVDPDTVFVLGSVTKTFTATAMMRLVADGKVELDAPVRRYVSEFMLKDERAAAAITVLNLLNHTAGLDWRMSAETGEGDDALALYVAKMAESELIAPPGTRASYSQVGYNLAGRVIEKVTGLTFERAVGSLLFEPLGLSHTFFAAADVITRRFAVGHNLGQDGTLSVARQWKDPAPPTPAGAGSSAADLLRWARFHLGDDQARAQEVAGHYDNDAMDLTIATDGAVLTLAVDIKPEIRAAADEELPPGYPREEIGLLPGDGDEYIITDGGMKGLRGFFTRDDSGAIVGIDVGGRMHRRVPAASR